MTAHWIERARRALDGRGDDPGFEIVPIEKPPLFLDSFGLRAAVAPLFAAVTWASAILRERLTEASLDPVGMLLRVVALGLTVRAILLGSKLVRRIRLRATASQHGLAVGEEGILYRSPQEEVAIGRDELVDVKIRGDWTESRAARRWNEVYLLFAPANDRFFVALPPIFDTAPSALAERLMRYRGATAEQEEPMRFPDPAPLASKVYEEAARGNVPEGSVAIRHGHAWLQRGPYGTVLLGVVILEGFLRLPATAWAQLGFAGPLLLSTCLLVVPLVWIAMTRRHVRPRLGLALVVTPAEVLMRTREGVLRVPFRSLSRVTIEARTSWSILEGQHTTHRLVFHRTNAEEIRYDEAFLGQPAPVVQGLCEAYLRGRLPSGADRTVESEAS